MATLVTSSDEKVEGEVEQCLSTTDQARLCLVCNSVFSGGQSWDSWSSTVFSSHRNSDGVEDGVIGSHLWSTFVLRHALQLTEEKCCELLEKFGGDQSPGEWFAVCDSCNEAIGELYSSLVEMKRLERKMAGIRMELKNLVYQSSCGFEWRNYLAGGGQEQLGPVQDEIRQCVLSDESLVRGWLQSSQSPPPSDDPDEESTDVSSTHSSEDLELASTSTNEKKRGVTDITNLISKNAKGEDERDFDFDPTATSSSSSDDSEWEMEKVGKKKNKRRSEQSSKEIPTGVPYYCDHCPVIYTTKNDLLVHCRKLHASQPVLYCAICRVKFGTKQLLQIHCDKRHTSQQPEQSPSLTTQGTNDKSDTPSEDKLCVNVNCSYCSKRFSSKSALDFHVSNRHFKEAFLTCKKCGLQTYTVRALQKHLAKASRPDKNVCEICCKCYSTLDKLNRHRQLKHKESQMKNMLVCPHPQCDEKFSTKRELRLHAKTAHEKKREHGCGSCGRGFYTASDLRKHTLLHTTPKEPHRNKGEEGSFICEYCQTEFTTSYRLFSHTKQLHSNKYPHICEHCGTGYRLQTRLIQHQAQCSKKTLPGGSREKRGGRNKSTK